MRTLTPAPWTVINGFVYGNGGRSRVPMCGADAQLIAAAPAMLAALQAIADATVAGGTLHAIATQAIAQATPPAK